MLCTVNSLCVIQVSERTVLLGRITQMKGAFIAEAKGLDNDRLYRKVIAFYGLPGVVEEKALAAGVRRFKNLMHARDHLKEFRK